MLVASWHFLLPLICLEAALNARGSCDDRWREGTRLIQTRSQNGNRPTNEDENENSSAIPPSILHAALKDHWLHHYKNVFLNGLNLETAPEPGSRRLPKSITRQLEMIKAREGEPLTDFDECPSTATPTKAEHVRDVVAQGPKSNGSKKNRLWATLDAKAKPIKRVVSSTRNTPDNRFVDDRTRSYFDLSGIRDADVANATLFVLTQHPATHRDIEQPLIDELHIRIYKFKNDAQIIAEPVVARSFKINFTKGEWLSLDITSIVQQWIKSPSKNYGIMIKAERLGHDCINRTVDNFNRTSTIILAIDVEDASTRASTVSPTPEESTCNADGPDTKCCRYPLEVNFEAFGWDWVIAPKRYNAYYCAGACPINYKQMSVHAHLMQQLEFLNSTSQRRSFGPCCTPQDYQDVKVVYIAQDRSIRETLIPGAIVLRCGCA